MRHGVVILPDQPWHTGGRRWLRAEEFGFDHAWTFDHLMWRRLRDAPWFSAMPTLTAAAAATRRLRLGTLVASPNLRHPLTFAKEMMTLDDISGGRAICGIGAGATTGFDNTVFGPPALAPSQRSEKFREFAELTSRLLQQNETDYSGAHFQAHGAAMYPGCVQQPGVPLAVAAGGARAMRVAARLAGYWITVGVPGRFEPERFDRALPMLRRQSERFAEACAHEERDPASVGRIVVAGTQVGGVLESPDAFATAQGLFAELGFTDLVVFWPRPTAPFAGSEAQLEAVAPLLRSPEPSPVTANGYVR